VSDTVIRPGTERAPVPPFTAEHEELRATCRRFVEAELVPHVEAWEEDRWFPDEVFTQMAAVGLLGLKYPEELGGQGGDHVHDAVLTEELARCGSGGLAAGIGAHIGIATPPIFKFGTPDQHERFLRPAIAGEKLCALAITEPDAGSDVAAIRTRAVRVDGGWVVNGAKMFITNGVRADLLVTAVKTSDEGHGGLSFLVVEAGEGVTATKIEKLGWHASDTALMSFDDVFVPEENLLGDEGKGFYLIMANFQWERLLMALGAVAGAQAVFEQTLQFVGERQAFGRPIGTFQASRHKLAECAVRLQAGRDLTYHALRLFHAGQDATQEVTKAKLFTQRMAVDVIDDCLQLHGGAGYMAEYGIERALRDARLGPIGGGTDEVMAEILGRTMGL
jgi:acyl-CoA dehydrogenase